MNICRQYLRSSGMKKSAYWMECMDLANDAMIWANKRGMDPRLLYIDSPGQNLDPHQCRGYGNKLYHGEWSYHAVLVLNDMVHDAWFPRVIPLTEYLAQNFPTADRLGLLWDGMAQQIAIQEPNGDWKIVKCPRNNISMNT